MLIMERKQLLINSEATSPIFNWKQKAYIAIFYTSSIEFRIFVCNWVAIRQVC